MTHIRWPLRLVFQVTFVALVALATFVTRSSPAEAYLVMPWKWGTYAPSYDPHTMTATWIQIASDGRTPWNNVTPSSFGMYRDDTSNNDVIYTAIDGPGNAWAGTTLYCGANQCNAAGQTVTSALMGYDGAETWYTDSACSPGASDIDARGVATHEFGHFATLNHAPSPATMYGGIPRGSGGCDWRSLETDDMNGLNAQYP